MDLCYFPKPTKYISKGLPAEFVQLLSSDRLTQDQSREFLSNYINQQLSVTPSFDKILGSLEKSAKSHMNNSISLKNKFKLQPLPCNESEISDIKDEIPQDIPDLIKYIEKLDEKYIVNLVSKIKDANFDLKEILPILFKKVNSSHYTINKIAVIQLLLDKAIDFDFNSENIYSFQLETKELVEITDLLSDNDASAMIRTILNETPTNSIHISQYSEDGKVYDFIIVLLHDKIMIADTENGILHTNTREFYLQDKTGLKVNDLYVLDDELHILSTTGKEIYDIVTVDFENFSTQSTLSIYERFINVRVHEGNLAAIYSDHVDLFTLGRRDLDFIDKKPIYYPFDDSFVSLQNSGGKITRIIHSDGKIKKYRYKMNKSNYLTTPIPPMFQNGSFTAASLISLKISQEMNNVCDSLLSKEYSYRTQIVSNPAPLLEHLFNFVDFLQNLDIPSPNYDSIKPYYKLLILKLSILCIRQIFATNQKLQPQIRKKFEFFINSVSNIKDCLELLVKVIPVSIYTPGITRLVNTKLLPFINATDILEFPNSLFFDLWDQIKDLHLKKKKNWCNEELDAFYYYLNRNPNFDFSHFLQTFFNILSDAFENNDYKVEALNLTFKFLTIISVSEINHQIAEKVFNFFTANDNMMMDRILDQTRMKFEKFEAKYSKDDPSEVTIDMNLPIFITPQEKADISTTISTDFKQFSVNTSIAEPNLSNVFLNDQKLTKDLKEIEIPKIDLKVIGNKTLAEIQISSTQVKQESHSMKAQTILLCFLPLAIAKCINEIIKPKKSEYEYLSQIKLVNKNKQPPSRFIDLDDGEYNEEIARFVPRLLQNKMKGEVNETISEIYLNSLYLCGYLDLLCDHYAIVNGEKPKDSPESKDTIQKLATILKKFDKFVHTLKQVYQNNNTTKIQEIKKKAEDLIKFEPSKQPNEQLLDDVVKYFKNEEFVNLSDIVVESEIIKQNKIIDQTITIINLFCKKHLYSLARTLTNNLILGENFKNDNFVGSLFETNDKMLELLAFKYSTDDEQRVLMSYSLLNDDTEILKNLGIIALSITDKNTAKSYLPSKENENQVKLDLAEMLRRIGAATYSNQDLKNVEKYVNIIRTDPQLCNQSLEKITRVVSDECLGAMVVHGAEIFDSSITLNKTNGQPRFQNPPPNTKANERLISDLSNILEQINFDSDDAKLMIKAVVTASFLLHLYQSADNKDNLRLGLSCITNIHQKITQAKQSGQQLEQILARIGALKQHIDSKSNGNGFIPLNTPISTQRNPAKYFEGSKSASSFFIYSSPITPDQCFKFTIKHIENSVKYIGLIDQEKKFVCLSIFNKTIFTTDKFAQFEGNCFDFSLMFKDDKAYFGDSYVDCQLYEPVYVFALTVADESSINYTIEEPENVQYKKLNLFEHNFDLSVLFPKVCIGLDIEIPGYSEVVVSNMTNDSNYKVTGKLGTEDVELTLTSFQIQPKETSLASIINRASIATHLGVNTQPLNELIDISKNHALSMLKPFCSKIEEILALKFRSIPLDCKPNDQQFRQLMDQSNNFNAEIQNVINGQIQKYESDNSSKKIDNLEQLKKDPLASSQIAFFNFWRAYNLNNLDMMITFFVNNKKASEALIPYFMNIFLGKLPNQINVENFLEFIDLPYFNKNTNIQENFKNYILQKIELLFQNNPTKFLRYANHSNLINNLARSFIDQAFQKDDEVEPKHFHLVIIYNRKPQPLTKFFGNDFYCAYPTFIKTADGTLKSVENHNERNVKEFGYSVDLTNKDQIIREWNQFMTLTKDDFKEIFKNVCESKLYNRPIKNRLRYSSLSLYMVDNVLSYHSDRIPVWAMNLEEMRRNMMRYIRYTVNENEGTWPTINYEMNKKHTGEMNQTDCFIYKFKTISPQFHEMLSPARFYTVNDMTGAVFDGGGAFRETLSMMVEELMDPNMRFFTTKPAHIICEEDCRIPSVNLDLNIAYAIGAALGGCIATNNTRPWNLPMFLWEYLATQDNQLNVQCNDMEYKTRLNNVCSYIRAGLDKVVPIQARQVLCPVYMKIFATGSEITLKDFSEIMFCESKPSLVNVIVQAIGKLEINKYMEIYKFMTGNSKFNNDKTHKIEVKVVDANGSEKNYPIPIAHTCYCQFDCADFKDPNILAAKLEVMLAAKDEMYDEN